MRLKKFHKIGVEEPDFTYVLLKEFLRKPFDRLLLHKNRHRTVTTVTCEFPFGVSGTQGLCVSEILDV